MWPPVFFREVYLGKSGKVVVSLAVIAALTFLSYLLIRHWRLTESRTCEDGPRQTIDLDDFTTTYFAYSVSLRAEMGKQSLEAKLEPKAVSQLSEALQSANETRKILVANYDACAITKAQYAESLNTFQVLDNISRQIKTLADKPQLNAQERNSLKQLVDEYIQTCKLLSAK